jgi:adenine-specific DNA-methyltransferase
VRYVVPPDGLVCDPFTGSGTMGIAARQLGRRFVGCDKEAEYVDMAQRRIGSATPLLDWTTPPVPSVLPPPGLFDTLEVTE